VTWTQTTDLDEFTAAAGEFLRAQPVAHTLHLTTADGLRARGPHAFGYADPRFGWWRSDGGDVTAAFLHTPPRPLMLTGVPADAQPSLVDVLTGVDAFHAERGDAEAIAAQWCRRTGGAADMTAASRLYRLGELTPPDPAPPGRARVATPDDHALLLRWYESFHAEIGEEGANLAQAVDHRISYGGLLLWEVDGIPVSMAGRTEPAAGMVRVAPVFTPREVRGRGYAAGATVAVSRAAARLADVVLLFTDLDNPTSNRLYQRLGYRPVVDRHLITLHP